MHIKGYAHRDIKMENILVNPKNYEILISDFELSGSLEEISLSGTPNYIAPELVIMENTVIQE